MMLTTTWGYLLRSGRYHSAWVDAVRGDLSGCALLVPFRVGNIVDIDNVHLSLLEISRYSVTSLGIKLTKVSLSPPESPSRMPSSLKPGT
jgi:hypothetical protein